MPWPFSSQSEPVADTDNNSTSSIRTQALSAATNASHAVDTTISNLKDTARTVEIPQDTRSFIQSLYHPSTLLSATILTSATVSVVLLYRRFFRRFPTTTAIPETYILPNTRSFTRSLFGRVTSVGDGDNFRLYHTPLGFLAGWGIVRSPPTAAKELKDQTIHLRLAGIDAPELAHFGKPSQPYGKEALEWLRSYLVGRRVRCYIHRRDQYQRVVGTAYVRKGLLRRDVGLQMIRAGLATVYEAKFGVEFGGDGKEDAYRKAEELAKRKRRGMWAEKVVETPRQYKTRTKGVGGADDGG